MNLNGVHKNNENEIATNPPWLKLCNEDGEYVIGSENRNNNNSSSRRTKRRREFDESPRKMKRQTIRNSIKTNTTVTPNAVKPVNIKKETSPNRLEMKTPNKALPAQIPMEMKRSKFK